MLRAGTITNQHGQVTRLDLTLNQHRRLLETFIIKHAGSLSYYKRGDRDIHVVVDGARHDQAWHAALGR